MNNVVVIDVNRESLRTAKKRVSDLTSEVKKLQKETKKLQRTDVVTEVFVNDAKFTKSFARTEKMLKKLAASKFEVAVSTNEGLVQKLHSSIKELTGKRQVVHIDMDTGGVFTQLNLLKRQLNGLASKKWNVAISIAGLNKKTIPWGYTVGMPNTVQPSKKQEAGAAAEDSALDAMGPIADLLTFYTAADLVLGKIFTKTEKGSEQVTIANRLLTKVGSKITAGGKIGLAAGSTGLKALSAATVAGGALAGAGIVDGGYHILKGMNAGNDYDRNYETAKGGTVIGSTLIGAGIGSAFGLPGALIGGGIGYVAGKVASSPIANAFTGGKIGAMKDAAVSPNAAKRLEELRKKQAELAKSTLDEKFGAISLSAEQVAKATENLFNPMQTARIYNAEVAASQYNDTLGDLQQSNNSLRKDMWTASTEGQLSPQKVSDLKGSTAAFGGNAQTALKEKHYADREAALAVMGNADESEGVLKSIDNRYKKRQTKLNKIEAKLNTVVDNALADGKITEKEQSKIDAATTELNALVKGNSDDPLKASLEKMDLGIKDDINWDSFKAIIESAKQSADQKADSLENSYSNVAASATEDEKKTLRWGDNRKGDKAGLYYQESGMYLDIANTAIDEVLGKIGNKLEFLAKDLGNGKSLSENIASGELLEFLTKQGLNEHGGLSKEAGKQLISNLDADTKATMGVLADELAPIMAELITKAKEYEKQTGKVPDKMQNLFKYVDMLHYASDNNGAQWFFDNAGKKKDKKFKLDDFTYLAGDTTSKAAAKQEESGLQPIMQQSTAQFLCNGKPVIDGKPSITAADFGIPPYISTTVDVYIIGKTIFDDPPKGEHPKPNKVNLQRESVDINQKYRGGIVGIKAPGFAEGGYVRGGAQLITVAEEGTPEAIIPLGRHRRKRAMELFSQVGSYLQAPGFSPKGFAAGGIVGGSIGGSFGGGATVVEVGGVEIKVEAKDGESLVEAIRGHKEEISEEIAGVFNAAFKGQFANTPAAGGVSA